MDANSAARELLGLGPDAEGTPVSEFPAEVLASLAGADLPPGFPLDGEDPAEAPPGSLDADVTGVDLDDFSGFLLAIRDDHERTLNRRYESILEATGDAVYTLDPDGLCTYSNQAHDELLGYEEAGVAGMSVSEILDEETIERLGDEIRELLRGDGPPRTVIEHEVIAKDGERIPVENHISVLLDAEGDFRGTAGVVRDVSERTEREERLERYERIVEAMGDGVYVLDADGEMLEFNEFMVDLTGYDRETVRRAQPTLWHDDEDIATFVAAIRELIAGEGEDVKTVEATILRADGREVPIEVKLTLLPSPDGEFRGTVGVVRDVTRRRDRERELEQYETIVETVPQGVAVIDETGTVVSANETAANLLGYAHDEFLGTSLERLADEGVVDESLVDDYLETVRELLSSDAGAAQLDFEATVDGERRIFETQLAPRPFDDAYRGVVGTLEDVTDERERRQELERYETLLDVMPDTVVVTDTEGYLVDLHGFEGWSGYPKEALVGQHLSKTNTPEGIERAEELIVELFGDDELEKVAYEMDVVTKDGERIPHENHLALLPPDDDGRIPGSISVLRDISERKERERAIRTLHDATREMVVADSKEAVAEVAHEAAADVLGLTQTGVHLYDEEEGALVPAAWTDSLEAELGPPPVLGRGSLAWTVFEDGEAIRVDDLWDSDGIHNPDTPFRSEMIVPLGEHGVALFASTEPGTFDDDDQRFAEVLCSNATAAMDRIGREEDLRQRERELARQNEQLEQFASVLSHDLRNPLNVAQARVKNAIQSGETGKLESADEALVRMNELIGDLLTLAREGRVVGETQAVSLADAAGEAWRSVEAPDASLSVAEDVTVEADRARLCELFENLFRNSVEHGEAAVAVRVGALPGGGFFVEDDGPGIPAAERDRVFEQGVTSSADGTGFGLAIVASIAEAHGWSVSLTEGSDGGARFEFDLGGSTGDGEGSSG